MGYFAIVTAVYFCFFFYYAYTSSLPIERCNDNPSTCAEPMLSVNETHHMSIEVWIYDEVNSALNGTSESLKFGWKLLDSCSSSGMSFALSNSDGKQSSSSMSLYRKLKFSKIQDILSGERNSAPCTLIFPNWSRTQYLDDKNQPRILKAKINLKEKDIILATALVELTRMVKFKDGTLVPYYKYSKQPILLRLVLDHQRYSLSAPFRGDGYRMNIVRVDQKLYHTPPFEIDDTALKQSSQIQMASDGRNKPAMDVNIHLSIISPQRHVFHRLLAMTISMAENVFNGVELDELKHFVSDEYIYRFLLTQVIGFVHLYLDYLAFRDEIRFYRGKRNMGGISASTIVSRFVCDLIIFLYLLDGGNTSWLILFSIGSGVAIEFWKTCKIFRPKLSTTFPFVELRGNTNLTSLEKDTADYDCIARMHLSLVLYPLVLGSALYARKYYVYSSWYSWIISNLANAVYTFGFISLCPQLYVNYRLKTVAHLPVKVFVYKIFNTFVDDIFAFMIQSPLKHKIMTLRDDVIFLGFLVQVWLYKVDKTRINEFGYAYEDDALVSDDNSQNYERKSTEEYIKVLNNTN